MLGVALEFKGYPDTTTPLNPTNLNNMQKLLLDLIYPIGTYYETSDSDFDPNTAWGGTWELDQSGTVLVSKSNTSGSKFNASIGTVVGEENHTLTVNEIPGHRHGVAQMNDSGPGGYGAMTTLGFSNVGWNDKYNNLDYATQEVGGNQAHNNVQPSKIVNRWHRTA